MSSQNANFNSLFAVESDNSGMSNTDRSSGNRLQYNFNSQLSPSDSQLIELNPSAILSTIPQLQQHQQLPQEPQHLPVQLPQEQMSINLLNTVLPLRQQQLLGNDPQPLQHYQQSVSQTLGFPNLCSNQMDQCVYYKPDANLPIVPSTSKTGMSKSNDNNSNVNNKVRLRVVDCEKQVATYTRRTQRQQQGQLKTNNRTKDETDKGSKIEMKCKNLTDSQRNESSSASIPAQPVQRGGRKRKRSSDEEVVESRLQANERERTRTRTMNEAFDVLRKNVPTMSSDKPSKIQTLNLTCKYIDFLHEVIIFKEEQNNINTSEKVKDALKMAQAKIEISKRKNKPITHETFTYPFNIWRMGQEFQVASNKDDSDEETNT